VRRFRAAGGRRHYTPFVIGEADVAELDAFLQQALLADSP
jgi:hypothetical protein